MKKFLLLIALILIAVTSFFYFQKKKTTLAIDPAIPVEIVHVKTISIPNIAAAVGNLIPNQSTTITSKVNGYVTNIFYQEGHPVNANTTLIQLDNLQDRDTLAAAQATNQLSQLEFQRNQKLYAKGLITEDIYYNSKVVAQQNAAAVVTDQDLLQEKTITAPFSGIIGENKLSIGDYVTAGSPLTTLVDTSFLKVEYEFPSIYQSQLQLGQLVTITNALNPQQKFSGIVTYISPSIDTNTQTIKIHATVDNSNLLLKAGEFVNVQQNLGDPKSSLIIPPQSILTSSNGFYVYVVKNNHACKRNVILGEKEAAWVEVRQGLNANDTVVIAGQDHLTDEAKVHILK